MSKRCLNCGLRFRPYAHILNQQYCSKKKCQSARKVNWIRHKLKHDKDYRNYKREIQKKWRSNHRDYWIKHKKSPVEIRHNIEITKPSKEKEYKIKILIEKNAIPLLLKSGKINCVCQLVLT